MTITASLNTVVSDAPYLKNSQDVAAVVKGIDRLREALSNVEGLTWLSPAPDVSSADYVADVSSHRRINPLLSMLTGS